MPRLNKRLYRYDLAGMQFSKLTVLIKSNHKTRAGRVLWDCLCKCGKSSSVTTSDLINGHTKSCGRCNEITKGQRFGLLITTGLSRLRSPDDKALWNCLCDCGNKTRVRPSHLKNGMTRSCGCLRSTLAKEGKKQKIINEYGVYVSSSDPWYRRGASVWRRIQEGNIKTDFRSVVELSAYLKSLSPERCPVFNVRLSKGNGSSHKWSPSADRINPRKGYVRGNIQIISHFANTMKQDATEKQLDQFAQWRLRKQNA